MPRLIERSAELKRDLVRFARGSRFERSLTAALLEVTGPEGELDEGDVIGVIDRFALQHRLHDGKTVVERILAARGVRPTTRSVLVFEAASVCLILVLMGVIYWRLASGTAPGGQGLSGDVFVLPHGVSVSTLALAATAGFLAFAGFESAGSLGEESLVPTRMIPRAIITAVAFGAVFYVACITAQTLGFGTSAAGVSAFRHAQAPLSELAERYLGRPLASLLNLGAVLSALGAGLGGVTVAARMMFAFGRDGLAARRLSGVSAATGVPRRALAVEMLIGLALLTAFRLAGTSALNVFFCLATIGTLSLLVMYVLTNVAAGRAARSTARARCSSTRWFCGEMPRVAQTSPAGIPHTSRMVSTRRWRSGSPDRASSSRLSTSLDSATFSGAPCQDDGPSIETQRPACGPASQSPAAWPSWPPRDAWGTVLASRAPRVRARLTRMENVQVRSDDRPSNLARPASMRPGTRSARPFWSRAGTMRPAPSLRHSGQLTWTHPT